MVTGVTDSRSVHRPAGSWVRVLVCLLAVILSPWEARAQSKEYQVKAAFLFNFAQFVDWPATVLTNADAPFRIGILGDNPFGQAVDKTVEGEAIKKHKMTVLHSRQIEDLQDCQLVFICKSEQGHLDQILPKLETGSILTVSECDGFAQKGGVINFYPDGTRVRFEINPEAARRAGLKISSQLMSLGKIVKAARGAR